MGAAAARIDAMNTCPKCGAPGEISPPDGDFRYRPPSSHRLYELSRALKAVLHWAETNPTGLNMLGACNHAKAVLSKLPGSQA
jgi:hypothetical protein